jgi:hypothetical protein
VGGVTSGESERNRFLIALAKFLGESPVETSPLAELLICDEPFFEELLRPILADNNDVGLTFGRFNQLMLACGRPMSKLPFYEYFFKGVSTTAAFEGAVERFRVKAMWLFGNFKFAYRRLATAEESKFNDLISRTESRSSTTFASREPFAEIQEIPEGDLGLLGYISKQAVNDLAFAVQTLRMMVQKWDERGTLLAALGEPKSQKIRELLLEKEVTVPVDGLSGFGHSELSSVIDRLGFQLKNLQERQARAEEIGIQNTQRYLVLPYLDVYVATSMRSDADFVSQHTFVKDLFQNAGVRELNLRYFDPTVSYDPDRVKKGLIEALMLRRAAVTIYIAGAEDTMGKDSELAATLAQGKPVIVFVQAEPRFVAVEGRVKPVDMERRAKSFRVDHPLGLQISARTGVAHGIIVVRTIDECAEMLRKVMLHDLGLSVKHESGNFLLVEDKTKSVVRVVTDDPLLSHSFWSYFRHAEPEPDI